MKVLVIFLFKFHTTLGQEDGNVSGTNASAGKINYIF